MNAGEESRSYTLFSIFRPRCARRDCRPTNSTHVFDVWTEKSLLHRSAEEGTGQLGLDIRLQEALAGGPEDGVVAFFRGPLVGFQVELHGHPAIGQALVKVGREQLDDLGDLVERLRNFGRKEFLSSAITLRRIASGID